MSDRREQAVLLDRDDTLLVLIDAQERLVPAMDRKEELVANLTRLASFASIARLPVLVSEQMKLGPTVPEVAGVLPASTHTVPKIHFDCFGEELFSDRVQRIGRRNLVLCGIEAHICVTQTCLGGLARGHRVHVLADATASRAALNWATALERMRQAGAVISTTETFIYELLKRAGTEEFRAVLPLVK